MLEIMEDDKLSKFTDANNKVLVLFFASWCPSCRAFKPIFEKEVAKLKSCFAVIVLLDDEDNPLWDKYGIEFVPTVVYFKSGKPCNRLAEKEGAGLSREELLNFLKSSEF